MLSYAIKLTGEDGRIAWFSCVSSTGIHASPTPANAQRWADEEAVEKVLIELEAKFGLDREEAQIIAIADDETARFWLDAEETTGLAVERDESGNNFLLVRYGDGEASADLPSEVAEKLAKVIVELRQRLHARQKE